MLVGLHLGSTGRTDEAASWVGQVRDLYEVYEDGTPQCTCAHRSPRLTRGRQAHALEGTVRHTGVQAAV